MIETLIKMVVAPFLEGYVYIFGDDPEALAYAGLFFVIFYACVFIFAMSFYEWLMEVLHVELRIKAYLQRRRRRKRIRKKAKKRLQKHEVEARVRKKIEAENMSLWKGKC